MNTPDTRNTSTLVCFGDSFTEGYGAGAFGLVDKTKSFPAHLQKKVTITIINSGMSGDTSTQGLARAAHDVVSKNAQIVLIEFGINDFFSGIPINTTQNNLQNIIDQVKEKTQKIYLISFIGDKNMMHSFYANVHLFMPDVTAVQFNAILMQYKNMFNALAISNNIELIENFWTDVWNTHMSDEVHPNADGYEIIAGNIFTRIEPYLKENNLIR